MDISRLTGVVEAGVTQPVVSDVITANIPAEFRDTDNHWFGLTSRARIIYAHKDRVAEGEVTTYEDLASDKWKGRICTRSGVNAYNLALGERRAESAKAFLTNLGIASTRLTTISYGEEKPVDMGQNEEAWAKNRRASFVLE